MLTRPGRVNGGIFGVPLNVSIKYANVAISLTNDKGESFIYGYVPIVVAKCGVFLKEQGTPPSASFPQCFQSNFCSHRGRGHLSSERLCATHQRAPGDF
jgi:hypothetical protein